MKYSVYYHVFPATFHVISRKIDFLWDSVGMYEDSNGKTKLQCSYGHSEIARAV